MSKTKSEMACELYMEYADCGYTFNDFDSLPKKSVAAHYKKMKRDREDETT